MWNACGTEDVHTEFWRGNLRERENLEDLDVDGRIILTLMLKRSVVRARNILIWLTIEASGGML
jgi:hypothetical protein